MPPGRDPSTGRFVSGSGVNIAITATDVDVTSKLTGIRGILQGIVPEFEKGIQGSNGFFGALMQSNLAMGALSKVQQGVSSLFSGIQEAMNFQTMSMSLAADIGTNIGLGFKESNAAVLDIQRDIAKEAAALPGVTKNYNDVFNGLGSSIAKVFPHDLPKFREAVEDVTKRVGMLAAVKHVDANEAGSAMNRAVAGTMGFGELNQLDIFQKNPQLTTAIRAELAKLGKDTKDWKELTDVTRLQVLRKGLKVATPDTLIAEFDGTVESLWQGITTKLFDPLTGVAGFMREIPSLNGSTVMDAVKDFLSALTKIWASAEQLGKKMGVSFDPLEPVVRVIAFLTDFEYYVLGILDKLKLPGQVNLGNWFRPEKLGKELADWLNHSVSGIIDSLMGMKTLDYAGLLGYIYNAVPLFLTSFLWSLKFENIGYSLGLIIGKQITAILINLPGFAWNLTKLLWVGLISIITMLFGIVAGLFVSLQVEPMMKAFDAFSKPVTDFFNWVGDGIKWLWERAKGAIEGAGRLLNLPGSAVQTIGTTISNVVSDPLGSAMKAGQGVLDFITGGGKPKTPDTSKSSTPFLPAVGGLAPTNPIAPTTPSVGMNSDKKVSALPEAPTSSLVASATFAPVINMPITSEGQIDTDNMLQQLGVLLDQQYQQFKSQRLAHGIA